MHSFRVICPWLFCSSLQSGITRDLSNCTFQTQGPSLCLPGVEDPLTEGSCINWTSISFSGFSNFSRFLAWLDDGQVFRIPGSAPEEINFVNLYLKQTVTLICHFLLYPITHKLCIWFSLLSPQAGSGKWGTERDWEEASAGSTASVLIKLCIHNKLIY